MLKDFYFPRIQDYRKYSLNMPISTIRPQEMLFKKRYKYKLFCIFLVLLLIFIVANIYSEKGYNFISDTNDNKVTLLGKQSSSVTSGKSSDLAENSAHNFWNHTFTIMNNNGLDLLAMKRMMSFITMINQNKE